MKSFRLKKKKIVLKCFKVIYSLYINLDFLQFLFNSAIHLTNKFIKYKIFQIKD